MSPENLQQTYWFFAIFAGILVFASSVGFVLKQRSKDQPSAVIENLKRQVR